MSTHHYSRRSGRRHGNAGAAPFLLLTLSLPGLAGAAENTAGLRPEFSARMVTYYQYQDGAGTAYPALGAQLSIERTSPNQALSASLFADLELTTRAQQRSIRLVGGRVRYRHGRWALASGAARLDSAHASGLWLHASKLQFRVRPRHKLAIEAIGRIVGDGEPAWQFEYVTNLTERLSVGVNVGLGSNGRQTFGSGAALTWDLH